MADVADAARPPDPGSGTPPEPLPPAAAGEEGGYRTAPPPPPGSGRRGRRRWEDALLRGAEKTGRATGHALHGTGRRIRRATSAEGAGESGLAHLIELHAVNSAGDMLITVALASTIFFSVPTHQARDRVALYLLITMAPFTLLAPVIGPLLDRVPSGRRAAMAISMLVRALLAWTMAGALSGGLALYPLALGVLVASKAYGVVRSVVVPRLRPPQVTLVKANSRVTLAGLLATGLAGAVGGVLHLIGPTWPLRGAFLVYVAGAMLAFSLPHQVDSAKGEERASLHGPMPQGVSLAKEATDIPADTPVTRKIGLRDVGPSVVLALRAEGTLRGLSGFLTFFFAFLLREHPVGGLRPALAIGLAAGALGIGNWLGTVLGSWLRSRSPETTVTLMLAVATAAAVGATVAYGVFLVVLLAGLAGLCQSLGKVALDALIQRDVPEQVRTSAFARSETLMQLCWVLGGALGIVLPLIGRLGTGISAGVLSIALLLTLRSLVRLRHAVREVRRVRTA
jgi:MFS family permease